MPVTPFLTVDAPGCTCAARTANQLETGDLCDVCVSHFNLGALTERDEPMIEMPDAIAAAGCLELTPDGNATLHAANGIVRVDIVGGSWTQRISYRMRRRFRMPARRQAIVWKLSHPVKPDESVAFVTAYPAGVQATATLGPTAGQVTTVTEAGAWPTDLNLMVWRCTSLETD